MKRIVLIFLVCLQGCNTVKPAAECEGPVRKVNQETVLASISCGGKHA